MLMDELASVRINKSSCTMPKELSFTFQSQNGNMSPKDACRSFVPLAFRVINVRSPPSSCWSRSKNEA